MFYTYVLQNSKGQLYKGSTSNLEKRVRQHEERISGFTSKNGPWKLVYYEVFESRLEAELREKFFKTGLGREFLKNILTSRGRAIGSSQGS
ncbi:MAG: GIY-YIG nuclease family protein [bacterium]|nr:GIY-YIG nuclease family protein [bacterium]